MRRARRKRGADPPLPSTVMTSTPGRKSTVLIIDDEPFYRQSLRDAMSEEGFRCFTAGNGDEGYSIYRRVLPDVVVLDRIMPQSGGTRFLMSVRENPNRKDALLVIYSSTLKKEDLSEEDPILSGGGFSRILEASKSIAPVNLAPKILELVTAGVKEV